MAARLLGAALLGAAGRGGRGRGARRARSSAAGSGGWAGTGQGARQATLRMQELLRRREGRAAGELFERWRAGEAGARAELGEFRPSISAYNLYLRSLRHRRRGAAEGGGLLSEVARMHEHGVRPALSSFDICVRQARSVVEVRAALRAAEAEGLRPEAETFCMAAVVASKVDDSMECALEMLGRARASLEAETQPSNVPPGIRAFSKARVQVMLSCLTRRRTDLDRAVQLLDAMEADRQQVPPQALGDLLASGLGIGRYDVVLRGLRALETMRRGEGLMAEQKRYGSPMGGTGLRSPKPCAEGAAHFAPVPDEGTLTACLGLAVQAAHVELGEAAWGQLAEALPRGQAPSVSAYRAYVNLYGAVGDLPRAFGALAGMEAAMEANAAPSEASGAALAGERGGSCASGPPSGSIRGFESVVAAAMQPTAESLRSVSWHDAVSERLHAGLAALEARKAAGDRVPRLALALLVAASSKAGHLEKAFEVFDAAESLGLRPDLALFNALIGGCIDNGRNDTVPALLEEMEACGLAPDADTRGHLVSNALLERDAEAAAAHLRAVREAGGQVADCTLETCARAVCRQANVEAGGRSSDDDDEGGKEREGDYWMEHHEDSSLGGAFDCEGEESDGKERREVALGRAEEGNPGNFSEAGAQALREELEAHDLPLERLQRLNQRTSKLWEVFCALDDEYSPAGPSHIQY